LQGPEGTLAASAATKKIWKSRKSFKRPTDFFCKENRLTDRRWRTGQLDAFGQIVGIDLHLQPKAVKRGPPMHEVRAVHRDELEEPPIIICKIAGSASMGSGSTPVMGTP
jgi:hypothetical protein